MQGRASEKSKIPTPLSNSSFIHSFIHWKADISVQTRLSMIDRSIKKITNQKQLLICLLWSGVPEMPWFKHDYFRAGAEHQKWLLIARQSIRNIPHPLMSLSQIYICTWATWYCIPIPHTLAGSWISWSAAGTQTAAFSIHRDAYVRGGGGVCTTMTSPRWDFFFFFP